MVSLVKVRLLEGSPPRDKKDRSQVSLQNFYVMTLADGNARQADDETPSEVEPNLPARSAVAP